MRLTHVRHPPSEDNRAGRELAVLWTRAQPIVRSFVRSAVRDSHVAEDILQQVALALVEGFDDFDPALSFAAWSIGIARHKVVDHLKRASRDKHQFGTDVIEQIAQAHVRLEPEATNREQALHDCLRRLQPRGRRVIELRFERGLAGDAIGRELGLDRNAVYALLHRVRASLVNCIERRLERGAHD